MSFKPFKWAKKHPLEAAAIGAGLVLTGGAAGIGPAAGLFAGEAAGAGAGALVGGAGLEGGVGAFGGAAAEGLGGGTASLFGPVAGASVEGALPYTLGSQAALFSAPEVAAPLTMGATPFAQGAVTAAPGMAAAYGPSAANASTWLSRMDPKKMMQLGMMAAQAGGGGGQQGGPAQFPQPQSMQSAQQSQADITKKWLAVNDPNTYRRIYGAA